jgi:putative ABC transport system permease protein
MAIADDLARDVVHGARVLRRNPGFAAVTIATLALGIGTTVTVFSIVDAWLLRPLSFPNADRLVIGLCATRERPTEPAIFAPYRGYLAWKERSRSLASVSAAFPRMYLMSRKAEATTVNGLVVTHEFFGTLGTPALLGRTPSARDVSGPAVVVLSSALWERQFAASKAVIGTHVTLNGTPHEVVGVMPRQFDVRFLEQPRGFELWTLLKPGEAGYEPGGPAPVAILGRLRDEVTVETARAELATIHRNVESAYTPNYAQFQVLLTSLQADNTRTIRATLLTVSAAVACLLLISCMNVGSLLVGRGLHRAREAAIRAAIGCGRGRLLRQFLTESLLLSVIGGVLGLLLAATATRLFVAWNPLGTLPAAPLRLDLRAFVFAAFTIVCVTILCGLFPGLRIAGTDAGIALRSGGERGPTGGRGQRAQSALLAAQIAASVVLLVATALLVRTFLRLQTEPLGFEPENLTVVGVALPADEFDSSGKRNDFYRRLADRLAALPGVQRVAAGTSPLLFSGQPVSVRTSADDGAAPLRISAQDVTAEFFETVRMPLRAGRAFDARDSIASPAVAVINEAAARILFGSAGSAVGRRIRIGSDPWREVVGIVANTRSAFFNTLEWVTNPVIYLSAPQSFSTIRNPTVRSFGLYLYIRAARSMSMAEAREVLGPSSSSVAVTEAVTASDAIAKATRQPAVRTALLGWFAAVSLVLAAIGAYGLVSQNVAQRMREIGIRVALGARRRDVVRLVTIRALAAATAGCVLGSVAALVLARALSALLYGVRATDALSFIAAAAALLAVTAVAALIPAARANRIDPVRVLAAE